MCSFADHTISTNEPEFLVQLVRPLVGDPRTIDTEKSGSLRLKDWSLNAYWNYDQYAEGSFVGPALPSYFEDNRTMLSIKYAF